MNNRWIASVSLILAVAMGLPAPALAQVKVLMSNGFKAAYTDILPDFEKRTGISVTTSAGPSQGDGPNTIGAQLRRGVAADVVILSKAGLTDLIKDGKITAGTDVDLAQSPLGLAVRTGSPKPDISTIEAFKQTILRAKSITFQSSTVPILSERHAASSAGNYRQCDGKAYPTKSGRRRLPVAPRRSRLRRSVRSITCRAWTMSDPIPGSDPSWFRLSAGLLFQDRKVKIVASKSTDRVSGFGRSQGCHQEERHGAFALKKVCPWLRENQAPDPMRDPQSAVSIRSPSAWRWRAPAASKQMPFSRSKRR